MPDNIGPTPTTESEYDARQAEAMDEFASLADDFYQGKISVDEYKKSLKEKILDFLIDIAILAEDDGYLFSEDDLADLMSYYTDIAELVDQMSDRVSDVSVLTENYVKWRARLFANVRTVYSRFSVPRDVWSALPEMPGDNCLGDGACGCHWEFDVQEDGTIDAYWMLGTTEHCSVCLSNTISYNPYTVPADEF